MKKGRGKDEDGQQLWQAVTRSVKEYSPKKNRPVKPASPAFSPALPGKREREEPAALGRVRAPDGQSSKGFDRATETKLRKGKLPLEGRLDLHGMTQAEALRALQCFLLAAVVAEKRTVLVITGKGGIMSEGVLKRMLPLWLENPDLAKYVIAATPAQPKDGGSGAFYLRLRRQV